MFSSSTRRPRPSRSQLRADRDSFYYETLPGTRTQLSNEVLLSMEQMVKGFSPYELKGFVARCLAYAALRDRPALIRGQALICLDLSLTLRIDDLDPSFVSTVLTDSLHAVETWDFVRNDIHLLGDYHSLFVSTYRTCPKPSFISILQSALQDLSSPVSYQRRQLATFLFLSVFGTSDRVRRQQMIINVVFCHWGQIKSIIEQTMASVTQIYRPTNMFAILIFLHNWMHNLELYQVLKDNSEFDYTISILTRTLKCNVEALVLTSVGVIRNIMSCFKKDVIPLASQIVRPVLEAMERTYNDRNDRNTFLQSSFALLTVMAKYSGSAFRNHAPTILPKVFSTMIDTSTDNAVYTAARLLLIETFLAIGPTAFAPYFKKSTNIILDTPSNDKNPTDTLLFLCFLNEYDRAAISKFYPAGPQIEVMLSRTVSVISTEIKGVSLLHSDNPALDLFLGILPKLIESTTVYLPEFDQLRDNLLIMIEELVLLNMVIPVERTHIIGTSIDLFCIIILIFYILDMMQSHQAGKLDITLDNEFTKRTKSLIRNMLEDDLMTPVIAERISSSLITLLAYDGSKQFPKPAMTLIIVNLRETLVSGHGRSGRGIFLTSPYDTPTSYSVGAPHVGFLQMVHVPDGFAGRI